MLATVQYTDSNYHNKWLEDASHAILDGTYFGTPGFDPRGSTILGPATGTGPLIFGSNGMLQSGTLTQPHGSWAGSNSPNLQDAINTGSAVPGVPFVNDCGPGFTCATNRDGLYFQDEARDFDHTEDTKEISANVKWDITPRLHSNFDAQYIDARVFNNDILVAAGSMANYQYSVNGDGTPQVQLLPGSNVNYAPGGLSNPHNYWIPFIQGHEENDGGIESAFRADLKYDIDKGGWLDSLKAGVRYADRSQTVRYSTFNWTPIAMNWSCNGPGFNADNTSPGAYPACAAGHPNFLGYGAGIWGTTNFNSFYNGSVYPNGSLVFLNNATITNFSRLIQGLSGATTNSPIARVRPDLRSGRHRGLLYSLRSGACRRTDRCRLRDAELRRQEHGHLRTRQRRGQRRCARCQTDETSVRQCRISVRLESDESSDLRRVRYPLGVERCRQSWPAI